MTGAVWLLVTSGLAGCFVLPPIPIPPSGTSGEVVEQLRIGEASREDVHALLGEPNRLASSRHEVWELEYDPFHIYFIMGIATPGGGGVTDEPIYFGEAGPSWSWALVEYDAQGKVAGWHWGRTGMEASGAKPHFARGASRLAPEPAEPVQALNWTAQSFALSPDGLRAALLDAQPDRKQVQILELMTDRRIAQSQDWPEACGVRAISLGFDGTRVHSVPRNPAAGARLCRWRVESGTLIADPMLLPELVEELDQARFARLIDRFIVIGRADGGAFIWDLSSDTGTALPPTEHGYVATRAAVCAEGAMLAIEIAGGPGAPPEILVYNLATGARRTVTLPGPATEAVAALAITPKGDVLAAHRRTHIEVWRLGELEETPVLEIVLLPPSTGARLAFSEDGQRLIAASTYAVVWETEGWREIGRGAAGNFPSALTPSAVLEISPDGSYIATQSGLWRIAPTAAQGRGRGSRD